MTRHERAGLTLIRSAAGRIDSALGLAIVLSFHPNFARRLRQPVALAYLLARTTDTVADTAQIPGPCARRLCKRCRT